MPGSDLPLAPYAGRLWRVIEGQFRSSTARIVDTDAEHRLLEQILEDTKPPVPEECRHLDYQFWSPFRYGVYPGNSRFRRRGRTPGVWYGSEHVETAVAESIWGKLAFFAASADTPLPQRPVEHTAIRARIRAAFALDLHHPDMRGRGRWDDPDDYTDCLAVADLVREQGAEAIRYASVRDPARRANVAVLDCRAFDAPAPVAHQTWHFLFQPGRVRAYCESVRETLSFVVLDTALGWLE